MSRRVASPSVLLVAGCALMCWGCLVVLGFDGYDTSEPNAGPGSQPEGGLADGSLVGDFALTATPPTITLVKGGPPANVTIGVKPGEGFSAAVALSTSMLGMGLATTTDGLVVLPPATGAAVTISLASSLTAPVGKSAISIRGTAGALSHEVTIDVLVRAAPGTVDTSFGDGGSTNTGFAEGVVLEDLVVAPDDSIVLGGTLTDDAGTGSFAVARHRADGTLDTSFGSAGTVTTALPGGASGRLGGLVMLPDGKLLAAGTSDAATAIFVARYTSAGALDATFGTAGFATIARPMSAVVMLARRPSGQLAVLGAAPGSVARLVALAPDGALDPTFADAGVVDYPKAMKPQAAALGGDGRVSAHGLVGKNCAVAAFAADGTPAELSASVGFACAGPGVAVDATGYRGAVGRTQGALGSNESVFVRLLLPDGGDDTAFDLRAPVGDGEGSAVTFDAQGRLVVALTTVAPTGMGVTRVRRDGTADLTFSGGAVVYLTRPPSGEERARRIAVQSDGRIVVAGTLLALGAASTFRMTRLWP